ncbi:unnamed protein product [Ectocarpus sp. CCAP 1310/34]|nr:unnamed protein product [Ectocarpus sp. CCAP 1310/34]
MDDSGRLTHIWWQTREQVALWNRYGHIALYDDTAVKNRYRMPLGVLAVIGSEYRTRIDADAAMTAAVREVFPDALARRCLWHLNQNIIKALAKVLGGDMKPFMDEFRDKCNSRSSLLDVVKYFSGIICSQKDAAMLRDAIDHLPPNRMVAPPATAFKSVLESCEFSIASWPRRFMEQEMTAAIMFCQMGGGEVDGPERAAALGHTFEYIEGKLCDVIYVFGIHEQRDGKGFDYLVLLFSDGSHLCQCLTLQTLGLFCRHVWAAMMHSPRFTFQIGLPFRFHVGLLHEHWLTEKARGTPQQDWPDVARPRWVVSNRHAAGEVDGAA